jgi:regulatory protein
MAQSWRLEPERTRKIRPPLDADALQRIAVHYVGRYATTRAKLKSYLARKVKERGFDGPRPDLDALAEKLAGLGYIDDAAFASARSASLQRRGYGERRIGQALRAAGIEEEDAAPAREQAAEGAWDAAMRFARRKRIGPYAAAAPDPAARQKAFAAMMRAGHPTDIARRILAAAPGDFPQSDGD